MSDEPSRIRVNANTRLHEVLKLLLFQNTNSALGLVMSDVLRIVKRDQDKDAFRASAVLNRMLELADREVEYYLRDDVSFYSADMPPIRAAISPLVWGVAWSSLKVNLRESYIKQIANNGQVLKKLIPECELRTEELEQILTSLDELRSTIEELGIHEAAKHKLRKRCSDLISSVEDYKFWGVEGIEVCFESAVAAMIPLVEKDEKGSPTATWMKVSGIVVAISTVLGNANTAYKNVHDSFLSLESGIHAVVKHSGPIIDAVKHELEQ